MPGNMCELTLRLDDEILRFFESHSQDHEESINTVLRRFVEKWKASDAAE